jgi:hypothetical protein
MAKHHFGLLKRLCNDCGSKMYAFFVCLGTHSKELMLGSLVSPDRPTFLASKVPYISPRFLDFIPYSGSSHAFVFIRPTSYLLLMTGKAKDGEPTIHLQKYFWIPDIWEISKEFLANFPNVYYGMEHTAASGQWEARLRDYVSERNEACRSIVVEPLVV